MTDKTPQPTGPEAPAAQRPGTDREGRLKAALRDNLARRKAQARARAAAPDTKSAGGE